MFLACLNLEHFSAPRSYKQGSYKKKSVFNKFPSMRTHFMQAKAQSLIKSISLQALCNYRCKANTGIDSSSFGQSWNWNAVVRLNPTLYSVLQCQP